MIAITCDACKMPVGPDDVVYTLTASDPARIDGGTGTALWWAHLHWDCVPVYGRTK